MAMNLPTILTGAAVTAAVGTAAYMMTGKKKNTAKQLKKKAGKAVQAVGDIVEGISNIMGARGRRRLQAHTGRPGSVRSLRNDDLTG